MKRLSLILFMLFAVASINAEPWDAYYVEVDTLDAMDRSIAADMGLDIHHVDLEAGSLVAIATQEQIDRLLLEGFEITYLATPDTVTGEVAGFPSSDQQYHDFAEMVTLITDIAAQYPHIVQLYSIGQSLEGRELYTLKISDNVTTDESATEGGIIIVGQHHAREHISREVPLALIEYLVSSYDVLYSTTRLIENTEIWITPSLNPDGAEYDIATGSYKMWRKNRRDNAGSSCDGVDLNRNYGYMWGQNGSSPYPCDETYRGASAFSEPETTAFKAHVESHGNVNILVTYHNYAELILYPWGYTYNHIPEVDRQRHLELGQVYENLTGYKLQQSSDLYLTSGDTTDWSYGALGITSFTIELSPTRTFYLPGNQIQGVIDDNLPPLLYFIAEANDAKKAKDGVELEQILADYEEHQYAKQNSVYFDVPFELYCGFTASKQISGSSWLAIMLAFFAPVLFILIRKTK